MAWHGIGGSRVVYYPWQVFPDPAGGERVYRFGCVTILEYASFSPAMTRWIADGGRLPGSDASRALEGK